MRRNLPIVLLGLLAANSTAQDASGELEMYSRYEPTPAFPFGRPNPEAPAQLGEFDFLVGSFDCRSELYLPSEGKSVPLATRWTAAYTLNGWAIQDKTWNSVLSATSIRIFDVESGQWVVSFFMQPYFQSGVWRGRRVDDEMVLSRPMEDDDGPFTSRLTFSSISVSGFEWTSEYIRNGEPFHTTWTIDCERE